MHPCFFDICPPRAADGPVPVRVWRRLACSVTLLWLYLVIVALLGRA
jgi:hypothetical protein